MKSHLGASYPIQSDFISITFIEMMLSLALYLESILVRKLVRMEAIYIYPTCLQLHTMYIATVRR